MPAITIEEGFLRFHFDHGWAVCKWDNCNAYRDGIQKLAGSKAVDFVAVLDHQQGRHWFLIEVKDFRKAPAGNRGRIETDLAQEVGEKVRDTLAGIAGAHVSRLHEDWLPWIEFVTRREQPRVVLWTEEVPTYSGHGDKRVWQNRAKAHGSTLVNDIKRRVSWLTKRVCVCSQANSGALPGVTVSNLPGAGAPA